MDSGRCLLSPRIWLINLTRVRCAYVRACARRVWESYLCEEIWKIELIRQSIACAIQSLWLMLKWSFWAIRLSSNPFYHVQVRHLADCPCAMAKCKWKTVWQRSMRKANGVFGVSGTSTHPWDRMNGTVVSRSWIMVHDISYGPVFTDD